ncbi:magnesium/cobalt transporter CorA [Ectothiorhodospiraceae bacterium 2226]|nr:magnesium/cobalt transporter CorA [Ectothiorhodospiraceae bacterium 2226]
MAYFDKRYHAPGTAPGTLDTPAGSAYFTLHLTDYSAERFEEQHDVPMEAARAYLAHDTVTWVHVQGTPDAELLTQLGELFDLHPLALEDVRNSGQRAKAEVNGDQVFVILNQPLPTGAGMGAAQLSLFMGAGYVVSFHNGPEDPFEPVRKRLRASGGRFRARGADYLLYALLDLIIDQGFPLLEAYGERLDALEDELLEQPSVSCLGELHAVRRDLLALRRIYWPQREVLIALLREEVPAFGEAVDPYLRDCQDHLLQIMEWIDAYREVAAGLLELYLSSASHRSSESLRWLTIIATLFIPPTFIVGLYGMNFDPAVSPWNMPELQAYFGYPAVLLFIASVFGVMLWLFRRKKWF